MNRKEHIKADMFLLGYTNEGVHAFMDLFVKYLGAGHRVVRHSYDFVLDVEKWFGGHGKRIAFLHLLIDAHIINQKTIRKWM